MTWMNVGNRPHASAPAWRHDATVLCGSWSRHRLRSEGLTAIQILGLVLAGGCVSRPQAADRAGILAQLHERSGVSETVVLGIGERELSRDDAVARALERSPEFNAALAELDIARADLLAAGTLRDPILTLLMPLGPKQFEATASWPVTALLQRNARVRVAAQAADQIANRLVVHGLDLILTAKIAHADALLAQDEAQLAGLRHDSAAESTRLARLRLEAGDVGELEWQQSTFDEELDAVHLAQCQHASELANQRLLACMGAIPSSDSPEPVLLTRQPFPSMISPAKLEELAMACRPEVRAAELAVEIASQRIGLSQREAWSLTAILDANAEGKDGFEIGPGFSLALPLTSSRAMVAKQGRTQLDAACARYRLVKYQVQCEVREADIAYRGAHAELGRLQHGLLARAHAAIEVEVRAHQAGATSMLALVQARRRAFEIELLCARAEHACAGALARLERSVGRNLGELVPRESGQS